MQGWRPVRVDFRIKREAMVDMLNWTIYIFVDQFLINFLSIFCQYTVSGSLTSPLVDSHRPSEFVLDPALFTAKIGWRRWMILSMNETGKKPRRRSLACPEGLPAIARLQLQNSKLFKNISYLSLRNSHNMLILSLFIFMTSVQNKYASLKVSKGMANGGW